MWRVDFSKWGVGGYDLIGKKVHSIIPSPSHSYLKHSIEDAMSPSNLVDVESPEHFKTLLSEDLNRVSCLNFWAPWAEPCAAFNQEVVKAAQKFPSLLFLKVSANALMSHAWRTGRGG